MKKRSIIAVALALVLSLACLTGCGGQTAANAPTSGTELASGGVLLLSVNPSIAVEYDEAGLVTGVTARNDDALDIIASCEGLIGQETRTVVSQLVTAIGEAGYFVEEVEGEARQITIEIEAGSQLPSQNFLNDVVTEVHTTVSSKTWTDANGVAPTEPAPLPQVNTIVPEGTQVNGGTDYGITDYANTDYGPGSDGNTDYDDTDYGPGNDGITDYDHNIDNSTDYGEGNDGITDYDGTDYDSNTDYGVNADGNTDYNDSDYGMWGDGVTDYDNSDDNSSDYGEGSDGVTDFDDYNDTDYGPNGDGATDYDDTDYGENNDGVTNYDDTDYGPNNDGVTDYDDGQSNYGDGQSNYDDGNSNYDSGSSNYGDSGYDD